MKNRTAKPRNWYYKILQVAKRDLGMDEDAYRDILAEFGAKESGGKISASTLSIPQLVQVVEHFKSLGFKIKKPVTALSPARIRLQQINKCAAIWHQLYEADQMRVPYSEASLSKFAYRLTKKNHIKWATPRELAEVIEALKAIAGRANVKIKA